MVVGEGGEAGLAGGDEQKEGDGHQRPRAEAEGSALSIGCRGCSHCTNI